MFSGHGSFIAFQNVQQVANQMKECTEIFRDLSKIMEDVGKSIAAIQEHLSCHKK
jgi:phage host-nuclease inhibitor protein Gam